jgi:dihydroorotate dehydrogenase (NAD+) catalytic subunit
LSNISDPRLAVNIGDIHLKNPLITCSGTFASGIEYNEIFKTNILGAVTTKSFSLKPMEGNAPPRLCETASGLLNSIGLQNEGIDYFIAQQMPLIKELKISAILSILGTSSREFAEIASKIIKIEHELVAVELNLSCPNISKGGITLGSVPDSVEEVTTVVRKTLNIPVIVKLSPNSNNLTEIAERAKNGGATCVSLINTLVGMAIDINTFKPKLGNTIGGLSGPAIKPVALAKVYSLFKANILPIIGMGGVFDWKDVAEFMLAGASAVGLGTVNFVEHDAAISILDGLLDFISKKNLNNISELIGKAQMR